VRIKRGFCLTASAAQSAAPGSIFLDGAAQAGPFMDTRREVYNLDHHEGCVRPFTLATCEQALVLVRTDSISRSATGPSTPTTRTSTPSSRSGCCSTISA
jgi:hypothetical protein